ncbi:MAG: hypothetical protein LBH36_00400 [Candidatus Nomurabacteria bacterium]|jgi:hypothetical protein|nr:hypothetical protein [Candidatus Nomurabacteria bacterium]
MDNQPLPPMQPLPSVQPLPPEDQLGASYLDKISSKTVAKDSLFSGRMLVLIGILVCTIIGTIGIMIASGGESPKTSSETLYLRATNLQKTATNYHKFLKSSSLRAANTTFQVQLTDLIQNLKSELEKINIKVDKIGKELKADESTRIEKINDALEDSRLNVRLDRDYAKEMSFQLNLMISLMQKIEKSAKKDYKTMLETARPKLQSISEHFSQFTDD